MPRARPNRTDLNQPKAEPLSLTPTGQEYGDRKAEVDAQRAVPIGSPATPEPTPAGPATTPASAAPTTTPIQPGSLPFLHPTNRPDEPVTAGLPFGAGPGPEALSSPPPLVSDTLATLADSPNASASVAAMAAVARSLGI